MHTHTNSIVIASKAKQMPGLSILTDRTHREGEPSSDVITEELNRPNEVGNLE